MKEKTQYTSQMSAEKRNSLVVFIQILYRMNIEPQ